MTLSLRLVFRLSFLLLLLNSSCHKSSDNPLPIVPTFPDTDGRSSPDAPAPDVPAPAGLGLTEPCARPFESKDSAKTCEVMHKGNSGFTYLEGTLLAPSGSIRGGALVFDKDGVIQCTGCGCYDAAIQVDATRISCPQGIISPGLVNAHDHLSWANVEPQSSGAERFEHRNDWRGGKRNHKKLSIPSGGGDAEVAFGEIRQLMVGTVSIAGSSVVSGFLRNVDDASHMEGLRSEPMIYDTFPLESSSDYSFRVGDCAYSRQSSLDYLQFGRHLMHVAEGIDETARNEFLCLSGSQSGGFDAVEPRNTIIHGVGLRADDAAELARDGTAVVWSPRSNISLYGNTASVTVLKNSGVTIALGTDWVPSGSAHMLREMQCAADFNDTRLDHAFTDRDLWLMMTEKAARAMKLEKQIGRLAKGWVADVVVYRDLKAANPYRSLMQSEAKDTSLVLRGGKALYGDAPVLAGLGQSCTTIDVCGESKSICYDDEAAALKAAGLADFHALVTKMEGGKAAYPLFFCEKPRDEPTCSPERTGEYAGITHDDMDGDGVKDSEDNCPRVFNPIRPMDQGKQADYDNDGIGDACDLSPTGGDVFTPGPEDRDHDGYADVVDNCPLDANPLQEDTDKDGIGDACDACALIPNPGSIACQLPTLATIASSRDKPTLLASIKPKAPVAVRGIVSAVGKAGYYIEEEDRAAAVYVYLPKGDKPLLGEDLRIEGTYDIYAGEAQIVNPVISERSEAAPVSAIKASQDQLLDSSLVGVLVSYEAAVKEWKPAAGTSYQAVFQLDPAVNVGSFFGPYTAPLTGDRMNVTGILRRAGSDFYIEPRSPADITLVEAGGPRVAAFKADLNFAEITSATLPTLTVTLDRAPAEDVKVNLASSDTSALMLPESVTLHKGEIMISFAAQLPGKAQANPAVALTASLGASEARITISVQSRFAPQFASQDARAINAWVGLSTPVNLALDAPQSFVSPSVFTATRDNDGIEIVEPLTLAAGAQTALVHVRGLKVGTSTVSFEINGSKVLATFTVRKQDLTLSEVFFDPQGEDSNLEWIEIRNTSGAAIDLSAYTIGAGGGTYSAMVYPLKGILPVDGCVVVGGPLSNEKNFFPTFFQAGAFPLGLQNGGANVDAIGIFLGKPSDSGNIPVDFFAYGETNKDKFLASDGTVLTPSLTTVKSGASAERHDQVWLEQAKPTPGDCSALLP